jgi:hypothetical protein
MGFATGGNRFLRRHCRAIVLVVRATISKKARQEQLQPADVCLRICQGAGHKARALMPVFRYFAFVGGALLALLLVLNWSLPSLNADGTQDSVDRSIIRIHSQQKWPAAVVFDTTVPTIVPPPAAPVAAAAEPAAKPAHEAFAMASEPAPAVKVAEPAKPAKPRVRRTRTARAPGDHAAPSEPFGFGSDMFAPRRETNVAFGSRGFWPTW